VKSEGERREDGESAGLTEAFARDEKGPIPWNISSDRNRAGNDTRATERTRLHEYRTAARARSGRVIDQQRAIANVRATGVVISIGQVQATLGILLHRSTAADNSSKGNVRLVSHRETGETESNHATTSLKRTNDDIRRVVTR